MRVSLSVRTLNLCSVSTVRVSPIDCRDCPPRLIRQAGNTYLLKDAIPFLVEPELSIEEYLATVRTSDLPSNFQKQFWDSQNARLAYMEKAKDLWKTQDVFEAFSSMAREIKDQLTVIPDQISRELDLSTDARIQLINIIDMMQDTIHKRVINVANETKMESMVGELDKKPAEPDWKSGI